MTRISPDTDVLLQLLLRAGLNGQDLPDLLRQELALQEQAIANGFDAIMAEARAHTLLGPVSDALMHLSDRVELPDAGSMRLAMDVSRIESDNALQLKILAAIGAAAARRGIRVVLMKGQNSAALYPEPAHRACGDIDIYPPDLTPEEFVRAMDIPQGKVKHDPDGGLTFILGEQTVEVHRSLIDLSDKAWNRLALQEDFIDGPVPGILAPGPVTTLLMFNTHILKHAMGHGIGLRQFCDIWLAYRKWGADLEIMRRYREAAGACGLSRWTAALEGFLAEYFGPWDSSVQVGTVPKIFRDILAGGNFGRGSQRHEELAALSPLRRKLRTFAALLSRAGFGLRYAPREYFSYVSELIRGQIS